MKILGVDNGLDGGLVVLNDDVDNRLLLRTIMPVTVYTTTTNKKRREYDEQEIVKLMDSLKAISLDHAFIEKAQAMPSFVKVNGAIKKMPQGTVASFSTGLGYGTIRGILAALKIPYSLVHPKTWQKTMFRDLPKGDTKAMSYIVCARLWPGVDWRATQRCRKPHSGLTDAALIAEYGRRSLKGMQL